MLLAGPVLLAHHVITPAEPAAIVLTVLGVLLALRVLLFVFQPQLGQRRVYVAVAAQLVVDVLTVRRGTMNRDHTLNVESL